MTRMQPLYLLVALCFLISGCEHSAPVFHGQFLAFGTINDVTIYGVPTAQAEAAITAVEDDFLAMHQAWHAWDPGPLTRTNALIKEGVTFAAPPSVLDLTQKSIDLSVASQGLFNPSVGRLLKLWGFQKSELADQQPPAPEEISALVAHKPSMSDISINGIEISSSNPWVKLDYGAIGKGYGIDLAIQHLRELGIENAIVNSGGDLRAMGSRGNQAWRIGVRSPTGEGNFGLLKIQGDESIFTSGNYERNYRWKNQLYHHIIDPRTGYPAQGTASVTVIHSDATTADAAATALFVAGEKGWHDIALSMGIKYVLLITTEGEIFMNPAMAERIQLTDSTQDINLSPPL